MTATVDTEVFTTAYTYDALNRLATMTDSQGGVTSAGYDANSNRTTLAHPNGVTTSYSFDALNRLTELRTETPSGNVLQRYVYTLGLAGKRTRIDEHDGTSRHYAYDDSRDSAACSSARTRTETCLGSSLLRRSASLRLVVFPTSL